MWVPKTKEEIKKDELKIFRNVFVISFLSIGVFIVILVVNEMKDGNGSTNLLVEYLSMVGINVGYSALIAGIFLYHRNRGSFHFGEISWYSPPVVMCEHCGKCKNSDNRPCCECGGKYVSIKNMKWVE